MEVPLKSKNSSVVTEPMVHFSVNVTIQTHIELSELVRYLSEAAELVEDWWPKPVAESNILTAMKRACVDGPWGDDLDPETYEGFVSMITEYVNGEFYLPGCQYEIHRADIEIKR